MVTQAWPINSDLSANDGCWLILLQKAFGVANENSWSRFRSFLSTAGTLDGTDASSDPSLSETEFGWQVMAKCSAGERRIWRGLSRSGSSIEIRWGTTWSVTYSSHGLNSGTLNDVKSLTLRVTSVRSLASAVAAKKPSMTDSATPLRRLSAIRSPQCSATA